MSKKQVVIMLSVLAVGLMTVALAMPLPAEASSYNLFDWMESRKCPRDLSYLRNALTGTCSGG